jgi:hypothetical protein
MNIVAGAAIDRSGLQRIPPHFLVGDAVGTDETNSVELTSELTHFPYIGQTQVENNEIRTMTPDEVLDFVNVARDTHVLKIGVQFCGQVFGHNAIRLGHNHFMWVHDSLSFTAPVGRLTLQFG